MKLPPIETSQSSIKMGLQFMSKAYFNARQWSGKFADKQYQHHYPAENNKRSKFGQAFTKNILKMKINSQVCGLCQIEKNKSQFEYLCKCHHSYCYSCLNSYAISKIEDLTPVKCPQQQCSETIILTSNIYRYLPDSVKLKYLANKNTFTISQEQWANTCQRCLQPKHSGQCKYAMSTDLIDNSFKHRECPKCKVEIRLTSGRKKVTCLKCNESICYLCGVPWANGHQCDDKQKIKQMEKQFGHDGCCQCCSHCCEDNCVGCGNCCRRQCGGCYAYTCCDIMFSCKDDPGVGCCLWNICSIPFRILLTLLIFTFASFACFMMALILCLWVAFCLLGGALPVACSAICEVNHCWQSVLMVIFFPITFFVSWFIAMAATYETPFGICLQFAELICGMLESNWIELSPTRCSY